MQHPGGGPKQFTPGKLIASNKATLDYDANTAGGSSDSPVFNQQWKVIALHFAGYVGQEKNAGTLIKTILSHLEDCCLLRAADLPQLRPSPAVRLRSAVPVDLTGSSPMRNTRDVTDLTCDPDSRSQPPAAKSSARVRSAISVDLTASPSRKPVTTTVRNSTRDITDLWRGR